MKSRTKGNLTVDGENCVKS